MPQNTPKQPSWAPIERISMHFGPKNSGYARETHKAVTIVRSGIFTIYQAAMNVYNLDRCKDMICYVSF